MGEAKRRGTYEQRKATALKTDFKYQPVIRYRSVYATDLVFTVLVFLGMTVILLLVLYLFKELK